MLSFQARQLPLSRDQRPKHLLDVWHQLSGGKLRREICDGPSRIAGNEAEYSAGGRREIPDAQLLVEENRRDLGTVEEVSQVAVSVVELRDLAADFGVDGLQFFVERLEFLLRGLQFLIGRLIFFVCGF